MNSNHYNLSTELVYFGNQADHFDLALEDPINNFNSKRPMHGKYQYLSREICIQLI